MDPIVGTRRVERPGYAWIAAALQVVVGLAAIPVGLQLMADADGAPLGLPQAWIDRPRSDRGSCPACSCSP